MLVPEELVDHSLEDAVDGPRSVRWHTVQEFVADPVKVQAHSCHVISIGFELSPREGVLSIHHRSRCKHLHVDVGLDQIAVDLLLGNSIPLWHLAWLFMN